MTWAGGSEAVPIAKNTGKPVFSLCVRRSPRSNCPLLYVQLSHVPRGTLYVQLEAGEAA
jgi:hypothetical protein